MCDGHEQINDLFTIYLSEGCATIFHYVDHANKFTNMETEIQIWLYKYVWLHVTQTVSKSEKK
jgi:hypothetical protein